MLVAEKKKRTAAGRPKGDRPQKKIIITFKGGPEFAEWVDRLASFRRVPVSVLIEHALVAHADSVGFDEPAPER